MESLQPWFIAAIAAFGVLVAYFQWRTAHQRVVLDLFDRRVETFNLAEGVCARIVSSGHASIEELRWLHKAKGNARFLFGEEVNDYLENCISDCAFLNTYTDEVINNHPEQQRQALVEKKLSALINIGEFSQKAPPIFAPYMRLDQKMPNTWIPF